MQYCNIALNKIDKIDNCNNIRSEQELIDFYDSTPLA